MHNLDRFIKAQEFSYQLALKEVKSGYKMSHWMWYIFPQIAGLFWSMVIRVPRAYSEVLIPSN